MPLRCFVHPATAVEKIADRQIFMQSKLRDIVVSGIPVDTPYIDVHCHFGTWAQTTVPHCVDTGRLIDEMDRFGCDQIWVCASDPGMSGSVSEKNDVVFSLAEKYPGRVLPYCTLSSNDTVGALSELDRCLRRGPCVGVKMHRYRQAEYTVRSAFLRPVFDRLAELGLVYLNHVFVNHEHLVLAAESYPGITFFSGHGVDSQINDLAVKYQNIRDCTCAARKPNEIGMEVARLGRGDTMVVGSDFGLFSLAFGIGPVAFASMNETDKRAILGMNALSILEQSPTLDRYAESIWKRYRASTQSSRDPAS
jgi:uncharacterized protein